LTDPVDLENGVGDSNAQARFRSVSFHIPRQITTQQWGTVFNSRFRGIVDPIVAKIKLREWINVKKNLPK